MSEKEPVIRRIVVEYGRRNVYDWLNDTMNGWGDDEKEIKE